MKNTTKTQFNKSTRWMLVVLLVIMFCWLDASGQDENQDLRKYLEKFPGDLVLHEVVPQRYHIVADYFNKDLYGNFLNKMRVSGDYTRGLEGGKAKWNNVYIANADRLKASFPQGEKQEFMENFTYIPSEKMLLESSFENFPQQLVQLKNLVWDMMGIEAFAWVYLDSLKLNRSIRASVINGQVEMDGIGVFENRDIRLRWTGITEMNREICAVIEYLAMDNPLNVEFGDFKMKGRSHYWGTVFVSMEDKQIEHAYMYEDVVMDMNLPGQPDNQLINTTREIVFEKLNQEL
jgi:hypothetical protein